MSRHVLLYFEDNAKAKRFVERVNGSYSSVDDERDTRVRAVWAVATKYCECSRSAGKMWSFSRGRKSGWWLHTDCGRPSRAWATGTHWFSNIGRNILPGNRDEAPQGWGIPAPAYDPKTTEVTQILPLDEPPTERGQRKAERRRNRKRTINPRRI